MFSGNPLDSRGYSIKIRLCQAIPEITCRLGPSAIKILGIFDCADRLMNNKMNSRGPSN